MNRTELEKWQLDLSQIKSIYIFPGSEGLWVILSIIILLWFIFAIYKTEKSYYEKIEEDIGTSDNLHDMLSSLNPEDKNNEKK